MNSGHQLSHFITHSAARNLIAAAEYAASIDRPFTRAITINWTLGRLQRPLSSALQSLLERMGRWLRRKTGEPSYVVWVNENVSANPHTHLLVWVPILHQHNFSQMIRSWLKPTGARPAKGFYRSKPIYKWRGKLAYILKGTKEAACASLGLAHKSQGPITGKRCGTSRALGAAARRKVCSDRQLITTWLTNRLGRQGSTTSPAQQPEGPPLAIIGYALDRRRWPARQRPVRRAAGDRHRTTEDRPAEANSPPIRHRQPVV